MFLAMHFIIVGLLIHLNIGAGILLSMLSIMLSTVIILKNKLWNNIFALFTLPLICINFIIFDLRHNFMITKALLNLGGSSKFLVPLNEWILQRINITVSMQILINNIPTLTTLIFILVVISTTFEIKNKSKHKNFLMLLAFYYFGYMFLSYFNKGTLLIDQIFLLIPISITWLAVLAGGRYKIIFIPLIFLIIYLNFNFSKNYIDYSITSIGRSPDSWTSMKNVADRIINEEKDNEFGYFVYSPDSFAYQQRYAMIYSFKNAHTKAFEYKKLSTTFVIVSPRPIDKPFMGEQWWIKNEAKIDATPREIISFPSGYKIEKFVLDKKEQEVNYDPNIRLELNFR